MFSSLNVEKKDEKLPWSVKSSFGMKISHLKDPKISLNNQAEAPTAWDKITAIETFSKITVPLISPTEKGK